MANKRKRSSKAASENSNEAAPVTVTATVPVEHADFIQWSISQGVEIHNVEPRSIPGRGIGLVTTQRIKAGERILFVPAKAIFTPDATYFSSKPSLASASISPQAQLAMTVLNAFVDHDSKYRVWKSTWPTRAALEQRMPMCWPEKARDLLPPTVQLPLERVLMDLRRDWSSVKDVCGEHGWSWGLFRYYWMIVNSRSFHWAKNASGPGIMVLCPFLDYMNHGPTGTGCNVYQAPQGYEVVADRDYGESILSVSRLFLRSSSPIYPFSSTGVGDSPDFKLFMIFKPARIKGVRHRKSKGHDRSEIQRWRTEEISLHSLGIFYTMKE